MTTPMHGRLGRQLTRRVSLLMLPLLLLSACAVPNGPGSPGAADAPLAAASAVDTAPAPATPAASAPAA